MQAKKKEIKVIPLAELGVSGDEGCTEIVQLVATPERGQARMLDGSVREKVGQLVSLLEQDGVL